MKITYLDGVTLTFADGDDVHEFTNWYFNTSTNILTICGENGLEDLEISASEFSELDMDTLLRKRGTCGGCTILPDDGFRSGKHDWCAFSRKIAHLQDQLKIREDLVQKRLLRRGSKTPIFLGNYFIVEYESPDTIFRVTYTLHKPRVVTEGDLYKRLAKFLDKHDDFGLHFYQHPYALVTWDGARYRIQVPIYKF
jgi:hypothetical protein